MSRSRHSVAKTKASYDKGYAAGVMRGKALEASRTVEKRLSEDWVITLEFITQRGMKEGPYALKISESMLAIKALLDNLDIEEQKHLIYAVAFKGLAQLTEIEDERS